ncbi:MAG: hypothetical protein HZB39_01195 [Planctomycetes bacterium]|nr:hypothetical protein [Planctomycetota bacterium]
MTIALLAIAGLRAQTTFHVYANPTHGDNAHAWARNPHWSGGPSMPLQSHPELNSGILGVLQHAPYPFRTLSGADGAVAYAASILATQSSITHVMIQCGPGLYGPRNPSTPAGQEDFDPASGLPWNGERFPIDLPKNVCVQGTSALDTIFDARGYVTTTWYLSSQTIFRFANTGNFVDYSQTFIDSVALRGCRPTNDDPLMGAAILIGAEGYEGGAQMPCSPRITNCFIYGNYVGIAMFSQFDWPPGPSPVMHRPWIVNNTIAWNQCGIYSSSGSGVGFSEPIVHNNLIDRMIPAATGLPQYFQGLGPTYPAGPYEPVAFEGLSGADLIALLPNAAPNCGSGTCFNAFDLAGANPQRFAYGIGGNGVRGGGPPSFTPVVDIGSITGVWNNGVPVRGSLFVRDVLRQAGINAAPHDFRLAPTVRRMDGVFVPNPLVNQGMDLGNGLIRFININITFGTPTAQDITAPPGIGSDRDATFHAFDWDCEGFGNPRTALRRFGLTAVFGQPFCLSRIDIGADEMGELIISGYLDSTRTFSRPHASVAPNTANFALNDRLFFLDLAIPGVVYVAPQFNLRHDGTPFTPPNYVGSGPNWARPEWYAQLGGAHNPFVAENDAPPPSTLTSGQFQHYDIIDNQGTLMPDPGDLATRHGLVNSLWASSVPPGRSTETFTTYPPFMRPRVCDIGSHLLDDIRVLNLSMTDRLVDYAEYDFVHPDTFLEGVMLKDIFQDNPWHSQGNEASRPGINDNSWMYVKSASGGLPSSLRNGTLNPPLTIFADPDQGAFPSSFLFRNGAHPIDVWGAPGFIYTGGTNGLSTRTKLAPLPYLDYYGYCQNFEIFAPDSTLWQEMFGQMPHNNLQTVLVVQSEFVDPENPNPASAGDSLRLSTRRSSLIERMRYEGRRQRR